MAVAANFGALLQAVDQVLSIGHGEARTLSEEHRFAVRSYVDKARSIGAKEGRQESARSTRAKQARVRPEASVYISGMNRQSFSSALDVALYDIEVTVDLAYFGGREEQHKRRREAHGRSADDAHRIIAALEYAPNLAKTAAPESLDTGLVSGALTFLRSTSLRPNSNDRLLEVSLLFNGAVEVAQPT